MNLYSKFRKQGAVARSRAAGMLGAYDPPHDVYRPTVGMMFRSPIQTSPIRGSPIRGKGLRGGLHGGLGILPLLALYPVAWAASKIFKWGDPFSGNEFASWRDRHNDLFAKFTKLQLEAEGSEDADFRERTDDATEKINAAAELVAQKFDWDVCPAGVCTGRSDQRTNELGQAYNAYVDTLAWALKREEEVRAAIARSIAAQQKDAEADKLRAQLQQAQREAAWKTAPTDRLERLRAMAQEAGRTQATATQVDPTKAFRLVKNTAADSGGFNSSQSGIIGEEESTFPWWGWALIGVGGFVLLGGALTLGKK